MKSLEDLCQNFVVNLLKESLEARKHKVGKWFMDINDWMEAMQVEQLRTWIQTHLAPTRLEAINQSAIELLKAARYHDLLACFFYMTFNEFSVRMELPDSLRMNEQIRHYILGLMKIAGCRQNSVQKLHFKCYSGGQTFYVNDHERRLIFDVVNNFASKMTLLYLPNVATNDLLQVLAEECHRLQVLCLQHSRHLDDVSVDILTGIKKIYRKGPLVKIVNQSDPKCVFRSTLRLLDISHTSVTMNGRFCLQNCLDKKKCKILKEVS